MRMTELPTGTVTFVFTDIEGSTQLLKRLGKSYGDVVADHRRILRTAVREHGGEEVDTQGDSFLFAFPRADEAAAAAIDGQRALVAQKWPAGSSLRVRMGIHTAEPTVSEEGYYGLGVHRAADHGRSTRRPGTRFARRVVRARGRRARGSHAP